MKQLLFEQITTHAFVVGRTRERRYGQGCEVERINHTTRVNAQAWWDRATGTLRIDLVAEEQCDYGDWWDAEADGALPPARRIFDVVYQHAAAIRRVVAAVDAYVAFVRDAYQPGDDAALDDAAILARAQERSESPLPAFTDL